MAKAMWAGRFNKPLEQQTNNFNASLSIDGRMYRQDILGSIAHAKMLAATGIISVGDGQQIVEGLQTILSDLENGTLSVDDSNAEDIHMFVEELLTKRIGDAGKRLHTARSRNDQVATDFRLYLLDEIGVLKSLVWELISAINEISKKHIDTIAPSYTHLQRAQPIMFSHQLLAYAEMLKRDYERLTDAAKRMAISPLGAAALAGTTYPIDRNLTASLLGFSGVSANSIDAVSDRDFALELASAIAIQMMHLSRFSEEIIFWCSAECKFMELDDGYATGSSIMPQKKNPDIAELVRGKTGRTYGNLITLLTLMKGLPLAYNKDMQEDKEAVFDSVDTLKACLAIFTDMLKTATFLKDRMRKAAEGGFINATDVADYLTKNGVPFRTAYQVSGKLVAYCIERNITLNELSIDEFRAHHEGFAEDIFDAIDMEHCANRRTSEGGGGHASQQIQIVKNESWLCENKV